MKKTLTFLVVTFLSSSLFAQTEAPKESPLRLGADIVSRYVWRGLNIGGQTPHIQPSLKIVSEKYGLEFGSWASYSFNGNLTETDLFLNYSPISALTFTINDYFLPSDWSAQKYFEWNKDSTTHTVEGAISFNGTEKIPFTLLFAMNLYGLDYRNGDNKIVYSKYIELGYSKDIRNTSFKAFAGACLDMPEDGTVGYYGQKKHGFINVGITVKKEIPISEKFSLPISASIITNPEAENIFFVFAISI
jgi:hypothetical protein